MRHKSCQYVKKKHKSNISKGSKTTKSSGNVSIDKTRLNAHAVESMQPHGRFPEDVLVMTLTICAEYL